MDAPFQAPEPTTEAEAPSVPGVTEVEPVTAPGATATGSIDLL